MATLLIDTVPVQVENPAETLGDLLVAADAYLTGRRRLVTALRIDGVEEPAFRDLGIAGRGLTGGTLVEIDSATPEDLAAGCLQDAAAALHVLADAASEAAAAFGVGAVDRGNQALVGITEGIGTALAITGAASLGLGVDIARLATPHGSLSALTMETSRVLDALIAGQLASDWPRVAAMLADGLAPVLRRWSAACASVDASRLV